MSLTNSRMFINELLNKDPYIAPEEAPIIISDGKSYVCMDNNGNNTKHTRHIDIRLHFVSNGEKLKIHKIDYYEGGIQLTDIVTKNVGKNDLNPRIKYIMVRLCN